VHCLLERVDALLYIVADKAHLSDSADLVVNTMRVFFNNATATRSVGNCCYSFFLLIWVNNQKACKDTTFFLYTQEMYDFFHFFFNLFARVKYFL
jgi:hypothetical protein